MHYVLNPFFDLIVRRIKAAVFSEDRGTRISRERQEAQHKNAGLTEKPGYVHRARLVKRIESLDNYK